MQKLTYLSIFLGLVQLGFSQPETRIAPALHKNRIDHVLAQTSDSVALLAWAYQHKYPIKKRGTNLYELNLMTSKEPVLAMPGVLFLDRANRKAKEETLLGEFDFTLNSITAAQSVFTTISGKNITISIKEKPFETNDLDLRGRIKLNNQFDEAATLHATFMATIAGGGGNTTPFAKGGGWEAELTTSDFDNLLPDTPQEFQNQNITIQNHSYGVGIENYYGIESNAYDLAVIANPQILHVFSSGNEGNQTPEDGPYAGLTGIGTLTGQFKLSKNTLTVGSSDRYGNISSLSSRGPAHDGRIKPELIAFGDAGSSESAAVVSGIAAMLQQKFFELFNSLPDAALLKSILINSATDSGRPQVDFESGYGNVNALGALRIIDKNQFFESSIANSQTQTFQIQVPANQDELKITMAWADAPASPFSTSTLVNDLDLQLSHPVTALTWLPWILNSQPDLNALSENAKRGLDKINNVEQITVEDPAEGIYEIKVTGFDVSQPLQKFFLAYQFSSGIEWTYPLQSDALPAGDEIILRWQTNENQTGLLAYRFPNQNWIEIESNLSLSQQFYTWLLPDTTSLIQFRITSETNNYETPFVAVSRPERLSVAFNCETEVMVKWNVIPKAEAYVIYSLGAKYLEPLVTVTDTFAIIPKSETELLSMAPIISEKIGLREFTINYTEQGTRCYFISFRAQQYLVTDTARFDIQIGTVYRLRSALLQRFDGTQFVTVANVPIAAEALTLIDPQPIPGIIPYRVALETTSNQTIYSDQEEVLYVRDQDLMVYPNPVSNTEELNIVINTEEAVVIRLYDLHGRLIRGVEDFGVTKTIDLTGLKAGVYLLKTFKSNGTSLITRLVVK